MPRQVPQETRQRWIELAEKGLSASEIRRSLGSKSDIRTIENAVNRDRADKAANEIRSRAYVQALAEHWAILLDSLNDLVESVDSLNARFGGKPPVYALGASELQSVAWKAKRTPGSSGWSVTLRDVETIEAQSLREHTGDTPLWRAVTSYSERLEEFIQARVAFARAVVSSVEHVTELPLKSTGDNRLEAAGLSELDGVLYTAAAQDSSRFEKLEPSMRFERDGRRLVLSGKSLIESASALSTDLPSKIKGQLDGLRGKKEWRNLVAKTAALDKAAYILQQEHALMKTMPALPGTCAACRRIT